MVLDSCSQHDYSVLISSLVLAWNDLNVRHLLLVGFVLSDHACLERRVYFIREMLGFQKIPPNSPQSSELSARVARWKYWSWVREPLELLSFWCFLLAVYELGRIEAERG